jgi:Tfp pilus assembly protein PilV
MYMTSKQRSDESGLSLVEAMVSIAVLSIAALAIGAILTSSFQQTNTAEGVLNTQLYGMYTAAAVSPSYSTAADVSVNVNISPATTAQNISIPDAVVITAATASTMAISVATAPVTSGSSLTSWWLP